MLNLLSCLVTVLDPRILYQGLLSDCEDNIPLKKDLDLSREDLHAFYRRHYTNRATSSASAPQPSVASSSPENFDFTTRYTKIRAVVDELEEYFKLTQESFERCDPIRWWAGRRAQFPNLSCLAPDIFSIQGKYAVTSSCLLIPY